MNLWNENRLIDVMSYIEPESLEEGFPECDLENGTALMVPKQRQLGKHAALVAGVTAGSLALTGVAILVCRKHDWLRRIHQVAGSRRVHAA